MISGAAHSGLCQAFLYARAPESMMMRVDGGPEEDGAGPSRSGKEPAANGDAGAEPRKPQKPQKPSTPSSGRLSDDQVFCIPHAESLPVPLNSLRPKRDLW